MLLLSLSVAGCSISGSPERQLPRAPDFARIVEVPDPKVGDDPLAIAAAERAGRIAANCIITSFDNWYEALRRSYAGEKIDHVEICTALKDAPR